jgi:spoIIIJ-associated protein
MEIEDKKKVLEEITKSLLDGMGFKAEVVIATSAVSDDDSISVEIQTDESKYLIGRFGVTLAAFQHICRILVRKRLDEQVNFTVDVNNYREKQQQIIFDITKEAIQKVLSENESVELRPMNSYERRLVHLETAKNENIGSESVGEDEERRVVIKPA